MVGCIITKTVNLFPPQKFCCKWYLLCAIELKQKCKGSFANVTKFGYHTCISGSASTVKKYLWLESFTKSTWHVCNPNPQYNVNRMGYLPHQWKVSWPRWTPAQVVAHETCSVVTSTCMGIYPLIMPVTSNCGNQLMFELHFTQIRRF